MTSNGTARRRRGPDAETRSVPARANSGRRLINVAFAPGTRRAPSGFAPRLPETIHLARVRKCSPAVVPRYNWVPILRVAPSSCCAIHSDAPIPASVTALPESPIPSARSNVTVGDPAAVPGIRLGRLDPPYRARNSIY